MPRPLVSAPKPSRRWWLVLFWAAGHWLALEFVRFAMELATRLPLIGPHLDPLVGGLMWVERVLVLPRMALRHLWWPETTPGWLLPLLSLLNSLLWGLAVHGWFLWRRRMKGMEN
jgi:hypothetical protein